MKKANRIEVFWSGLKGKQRRIGQFHASKQMTNQLTTYKDFSVDIHEEVFVETIDSANHIRNKINESSQEIFNFKYFKKKKKRFEPKIDEEWEKNGVKYKAMKVDADYCSECCLFPSHDCITINCHRSSRKDRNNIIVIEVRE